MIKISPSNIQACADQDYKAIKSLYEDIYGLLFSISVRYQKDHHLAEEAVNDSFIKILKGLKKYDFKTPFTPWVRRICINHNIDKLRSKKRKSLGKQEELTAVKLHKFEFNEGYRQLSKSDLLSTIQELPTMERKVFNMYAIDGYKHKEIGEILGIPVGTSKSHLFRARKMLQEKLKKVQLYEDRFRLVQNG
jgi:RNA polymerase sigma-70 factor (ECF subfamily)